MNPTRPDPVPPSSAREIESVAAEWLARRDAGLDPARTAELLGWLAADARHADAFHRLDAVWRSFDGPRLRGEAVGMVQQLEQRHRRRRRRTWSVVTVSTTLAAAAAWMVVVQPAKPGLSPAHVEATVAGVMLLRPEHRVLPDGSVVELNRGARIEVNYSASRRDIRLAAGDAHFTVAKDPARPFVVTTPRTAVRAVGTVFCVSVQAPAIDLVVTEGKVAVNADATADNVFVTAGSRCLLPVGTAPGAPLRVQPITAAEVERALAWRAPRLNLSGTPLGDVAAAFNRENRVQLTIADANLRALQLTGVFRADRVEDFVRLLEANYGVRVNRRSATEIVLDRP